MTRLIAADGKRCWYLFRPIEKRRREPQARRLIQLGGWKHGSDIKVHDRLKEMAVQKCDTVPNGPATTRYYSDSAFSIIAQGTQGALIKTRLRAPAASRCGRHISAGSKTRDHVENVESPNRVVQRIQ